MPANAIDLTTLEEVKSWAQVPSANTSDDSDIQDAITGFSQWILNFTGVASFNNVVQYTETRNGNGNNQMFVRNPPIAGTNVTVVVNGVNIPLAGAYPAFGFFVSDDAKSILIRAVNNPSNFSWFPTYGFSWAQGGGVFARGIGNVQLSYPGGYSAVPFDLEFAVRRAVAINYKRKQTLDLASRIVSADKSVATVRYRDWKIPPEMYEVFIHYRRVAII